MGSFQILYAIAQILMSDFSQIDMNCAMRTSVIAVSSKEHPGKSRWKQDRWLMAFSNSNHMDGFEIKLFCNTNCKIPPTVIGWNLKVCVSICQDYLCGIVAWQSMTDEDVQTHKSNAFLTVLEWLILISFYFDKWISFVE